MLRPTIVSVAEFITVRFQLALALGSLRLLSVSVAEFITVRFQLQKAHFLSGFCILFQ